MTDNTEREALADEISGIVVGSGYYATTIGITAALEAADVILASDVWRNHQVEAVSGPAYVGIMPPSPETARRWYTMYCRECGIEEGMAEDADSLMLAGKRDAHNRWHAARPVITDEMVDRAARGLWVAEQDDHDWAVSVVDDVFSPPDDYTTECMEAVYRARAVLEAVFGENHEPTDEKPAPSADCRDCGCAPDSDDHLREEWTCGCICHQRSTEGQENR